MGERDKQFFESVAFLLSSGLHSADEVFKWLEMAYKLGKTDGCIETLQLRGEK